MRKVTYRYYHHYLGLLFGPCGYSIESHRARRAIKSVFFKLCTQTRQNRIVRLGHKSVQVTEISVLAPTFTVMIRSDASNKTQTHPNTMQCGPLCN